MSSRAPIGHLAIAACELTTNQGCRSFVCHKDVRPEYVYYWLRHQREAIKSMGSGSTFSEISGSRCKEIPFLLPPLAEQERIVAKIEELLAHVNAASERLARVPTILKRFRQAVLAAACSGRLTEDWRNEQSSNDIAEDGLPTGWRWQRVDELLPKGGIFDGPFGSNLKTSDYKSNGVRVIRLENVGHLRFDDSKRTFISEAKYESLRKHTVRAGDILFASFVADEIEACLVPVLPTTAIAKADCFCVRPDRQQVSARFLLLQLVSDASYAALKEEVHGATRPRVNTSQLRALAIRMCPRTEQDEIVRRVDALFALADKIEERVAAASARADGLTQAILAKAFRGELVPTEAKLARREGRDYEPASTLLERIRAEREKAGDGGKRGRRGKRTERG